VPLDARYHPRGRRWVTASMSRPRRARGPQPLTRTPGMMVIAEMVNGRPATTLRSGRLGVQRDVVHEVGCNGPGPRVMSCTGRRRARHSHLIAGQMASSAGAVRIAQGPAPSRNASGLVDAVQRLCAAAAGQRGLTGSAAGSRMSQAIQNRVATASTRGGPSCEDRARCVGMHGQVHRLPPRRFESLAAFNLARCPQVTSRPPRTVPGLTTIAWEPPPPPTPASSPRPSIVIQVVWRSVYSLIA